MTFKVGDRVRYNTAVMASGPWRNSTWRIATLSEKLPGQGDRIFALLESDDGRTEPQPGISTNMLVPAWDGPLDRNYLVTVPCPHCGNPHAQLLPPRGGDRSDYCCPTCGDFSVDGSAERLFELGTADPKTAQLIMLAGRHWLKPL
jgi:hypothetical protein